MTTTTTMSNLDGAKFRKVHGLMTGGATAGERAAAKARAEAMAARAGLTLAQAVSNLDAKPVAQPRNFFEGFDDWMEAKEPGWKAERAAERSKRECVRAAKRTQALNEHGSRRTILARTQREELLLAAAQPLASESSTWTDDDGTVHIYLNLIDGCGDGGYLWRKDMTPKFIAAVERAYLVPSNLDDVLAEWRDWRKLQELRDLFVDSCEWVHYIEVQGRIAVLEDRLDRQPVASWSDMSARMEWWAIRIDRELAPSPEEERELHARISADHEILARLGHHGVAIAPVHSGHRTNADKRADVLSMLDARPDLPDREIARRVGVSPQTVNNWRRRAQERTRPVHQASQGCL